MSTTATRPDVVAATRPYALFAIGQHVADHGLSFESVDVRHEVGVWVHVNDVHAWRTTSVTQGDHMWRPTVLFDGDGFVHTVPLRLDGSCVEVALRWITWVDHAICELYDECMTGLCSCRDVPTCEGRDAHACSHGRNLCEFHQGECADCREGRVS